LTLKEIILWKKSHDHTNRASGTD